MTRTLISLTALLLVACLFIGCGGEPRPAGMPKLYPASIVVNMDGAPLGEAFVQLMPEDTANAEWGPGGRTDASGVAVLHTNGKYPGVPLGTYKVVVTKIEETPHPNPEWAGLPPDDPNYWKYVQIAENLKPREVVAAKYGSIAGTPLRVEITDKEKKYPVEVEKR